MCALSESGTECRGDSGGPVIWNDGHQNVQVGIVKGTSCATNDSGTFERISYYYDWIINNVQFHEEHKQVIVLNWKQFQDNEKISWKMSIVVKCCKTKVKSLISLIKTDENL